MKQEYIDTVRLLIDIAPDVFTSARFAMKGGTATSGSTAADDDTYNLIMRDKEKLLSFESPLKFIFSHSALKEGWDNPNVFQICNFSTRETERWRRQTHNPMNCRAQTSNGRQNSR